MATILVVSFGILIVAGLVYVVFFADGLPFSQLFKRRFSDDNQF